MKQPAIVERTIVTRRSARYYTAGATGAGCIWLVLHGYGQLASEFIQDFLEISGDERQVVAPEGLSRFYLRAGQGSIGANWMTSEDRQREIGDYITYLDLVSNEVRVRDDQRLFVLGFSQGAATACRWFSDSSRPLQGIAIWGGGVPPDLEFGAFSKRLGNDPLSFVWGDSDIFMSENRFRAELQSLKEQNINHRPVQFDGGHTIEPSVLAELVDFHEAQ